MICSILKLDELFMAFVFLVHLYMQSEHEKLPTVYCCFSHF